MARVILIAVVIFKLAHATWGACKAKVCQAPALVATQCNSVLIGLPACLPGMQKMSTALWTDILGLPTILVGEVMHTLVAIQAANLAQTSLTDFDIAPVQTEGA